jgi:putative restriction endonuclease
VGEKIQGVRSKSWTEAVTDAVQRHVAKTGSSIFTRQALIDAELDAIVADTGSAGATPHQTLSRELQQLRDAGVLEFVDHGAYKLLNLPARAEEGTCKGVFVVGSHSIYEDEPERFYRFPSRWMRNAAKVVGNWIIYQEPRRSGQRGYYATAKVKRIVPDPANVGMFLALIELGTYLEFGRDVPFQVDGQAVERGLIDPNGRLNNGRAVQSIRPISDSDFNRIIGLGIVEEDEVPQREDQYEPVSAIVQEGHMLWEPPIDRATTLVNRIVRNRQFRKRVLEAYGAQCALTGMKLINGRAGRRRKRLIS